MDNRERELVLEKIRTAVATVEESELGGVMRDVAALARAAAELYEVFLHGGEPDECVPWRMPLPKWADDSAGWGVSEAPRAAWCELLQAEMDIEESSDLKHVDRLVMERLRRIVRLLETNFDRFGKWEERQ